MFLLKGIWWLLWWTWTWITSSRSRSWQTTRWSLSSTRSWGASSTFTLLGSFTGRKSPSLEIINWNSPRQRSEAFQPRCERRLWSEDTGLWPGAAHGRRDDRVRGDQVVPGPGDHAQLDALQPDCRHLVSRLHHGGAPHWPTSLSWRRPWVIRAFIACVVYCMSYYRDRSDH